MNKILQIATVVALAMMSLTACEKTARDAELEKKTEVLKNVTAVQLEDARSVAKANSEFNAQMYKAANPRFTADFSIIARSDTTQSIDCPMGDGWAELSIMKVEDKKVDKTVIMCSTYSANVGCYRKEDFDKDKNLAGQDGVCNKAIPFPLPSLKK
jgi:hypothetical protein